MRACMDDRSSVGIYTDVGPCLYVGQAPRALHHLSHPHKSEGDSKVDCNHVISVYIYAYEL